MSSVAQEPLVHRVHGDHLAGPEAAFFDDFGVVEFDGADLRAERENAVVGQLVARGAQAVAVQARADGQAVAENQRGGAVPRLVETGVVLVKRGEFGRHAGVAAPGTRDQHSHGVENVAPAHDESFKRVIEAGTIGAAGLDDGFEQIDVLAPEIGGEFGLAGVHPVAVAAHGVNLAVVAQHAKGLPERPRREGIRAVTLVENAERRVVLGVGEVAVKLVERRGNQQALVNDDAAGKRRDVEILDLVGGGEFFDLVARQEQAAFVVVRAHAPGLADEHLFDARHGELRFVAEHADVGRHLAPAEQKQTARGEHFFGDGLGAGLGVGVIVREETEAHAEVGVLINVVPKAADFLAQDGVGKLREQSRAVAGLGVGVERAAVAEVAKRLDAVLEHPVGAFAADVSDEPDAAGIVLVLGLIKRRHPARGFLHGLVHHGNGCPWGNPRFPDRRSVDIRVRPGCDKREF